MRIFSYKEFICYKFHCFIELSIKCDSFEVEGGPYKSYSKLIIECKAWVLMQHFVCSVGKKEEMNNCSILPTAPPVKKGHWKTLYCTEL